MEDRKFGVLLLVVFFLVAAAFGGTIDGPYTHGKRIKDEISFQPQMRYGRSGRDAPKLEETFRSNVLVVPRAEKFYSGTRYGKRSGKGALLERFKICDAKRDYVCTPTGVSDLFRCTKRKFDYLQRN